MEYLMELLNQAQSILDAGFDVDAFLAWKSFAFFSVVVLLGPTHYYAKNFNSIISENTPKGLLAGKGVLIAVKEALAQHPKMIKTLIHANSRNQGS